MEAESEDVVCWYRNQTINEEVMCYLTIFHAAKVFMKHRSQPIKGRELKWKAKELQHWDSHFL